MTQEIMMKNGGTVIELLTRRYKDTETTDEMTLVEYLELCKKDPVAYANAAERMLIAIGKPKIIDTSKDARLSRIFMNRTIRVWPETLGDFYGHEEVHEQLYDHFQAAALDLEEAKQILYLLGPVAGGKSSLAARLMKLMEKHPIYVLCANSEISPVFEPALLLFDPDVVGERIEKEYGIPRHRLGGVMSPWATKRLMEFGGDYTKFRVRKLFPSVIRQIGIARVEASDENNQDVSSLIGKVDIRKIEVFSQSDPDAYSYSGGLNRTTPCIMEFVEMFKAPLPTLHPLLTATPEHHYAGNENIGQIPYFGIIVAHSNETEWQQFKNRRANEALLSRITTIKVPYVIRVDEEIKIYEKLLRESGLAGKPCAPETLKMLARFAILSSLKAHKNSDLWTKMRVYNGEPLKDTGPQVKSVQEYKDVAGVDEGMTGFDRRLCFKVLAATFHYDVEEVAADPVHLRLVLEKKIRDEQFPEETESRYLEFLEELMNRYAEFLEHEILRACLPAYDDLGQNRFDRYIAFADAWASGEDYKDPDTGNMFDREALDKELSQLEKPSGIANPKDFRQEVVRFVLRAAKENDGNNPNWKSYQKMRDVIEKSMFEKMEDMLPVISFETKKDKDAEEKHKDFVSRMKDRGYTVRQVRRLVEWHMRVRKSSSN